GTGSGHHRGEPPAACGFARRRAAEDRMSAARRASAVRPEPRQRTSLPDRLLDIHEAAGMLGLKSARTLYKWAYAGRIPSVKIGRLLRFRRSHLERLIVAGERPTFASPDGFPLTASAVAR